MKIPVVRNATFQRVSAVDNDDVICRGGVTSSLERRYIQWRQKE